MLTVPVEIMVVLQHFAPVFSARIWDWVQGLVVGALLSPRQRTVCAALRAVGLRGVFNKRAMSRQLINGL